jgi:hypothetical protein
MSCWPARICGAVAAGGAHEPTDRPSGALLHEPADGQRGEHHREVGVDGFAFVVVDRPGGQVVLGHPERGFDLVEPVVGADHEHYYGRARRQSSASAARSAISTI